MNASADISDAGIIFANNLSDLAIRSQNYEDATIVRLAFTTLNNKLINPDYVFLQNFDNSRSSSLYRIIYGDGTYCGLGGLIGRTKGSGLSSSIPATIYSAISGDTNGEN
jgi:hypothetical protein